MHFRPLRKLYRIMKKLPRFLRERLSLRFSHGEEYKDYTKEQFDRTASWYDKSDDYKNVAEDYPDVRAEISGETFSSLLDCGCGTGALLVPLREAFPGIPFTGIDLSEGMLGVAKARQLPDTVFLAGDCEALPFAEASFDVVLCCHSFHHYPHPRAFFSEAFRVLKKGGRLILRDNTGSLPWLLYYNLYQIPLQNFRSHSGDVRFYSTREVARFLKKAGFLIEKNEMRKGHKLHVSARKPS